MDDRIRFGKKHHHWLIALVVAVTLSVAIPAWYSHKANGPDLNNRPNDTKNIQRAKIVSASSKWLFIGDTFFGRYINDWSEASQLKEKYPFQRLNEFDRKSYQAWIANLECPSVENVKMTSAEMNRTLTFNCDPKYLPEASNWFDLVSLGNNHTDNQGLAGFEKTKQNLIKNDIQYFGSHDPRDVDNVCNVGIVTFNIKYDVDDTKPIDLPVGFCGYNAVFRIPTNNDISSITEYSEILPTIVMPHMGVEYKTAPDRLRIDTYHKMIDAGAEAVIGGHPHYIQPSEAYRGKLIVYSLGNFMFDQQSGIEKTRSAMIEFEVSVKNIDQIEGWSKISKQCKNNFSECAVLAKKYNLSKLEFTYIFDVHGSNDSNKLVKPATESELRSIKDRLNWESTMKNLGQS